MGDCESRVRAPVTVGTEQSCHRSERLTYAHRLQPRQRSMHARAALGQSKASCASRSKLPFEVCFGPAVQLPGVVVFEQ